MLFDEQLFNLNLMLKKSAKYEVSKLQIVTMMFFCAILLGLNIWLIKQNGDLKQANQQLRNLSEIIVGEKLLPFAGVDGQGNKTALEPSENAKTLLLVYTSTCKYCNQNASNWKKIVKAAQSNPLRIAAVSLFAEDANAFIHQYSYLSSVPIISQTQGNFRFTRTPQTILVDSKGKVEKVWDGLLDEKSLQEIGETLNLQFQRVD